MDLKSLLQESPSEDHRRRQDLREREDRERERERRGQERNREQWDRENELRQEREPVRLPQAVLRSPTRPFSPVPNAASSSSTSLPPYGSHRSAARERDYDSHPPMRSYNHENARAPPPAGPGLPPPPSSSSRAHSPPPATASAPGLPLFHSPLTAQREPPMMGPGAPPEYALEYGPGSRERKQNLSQPHSHSRQALPTLGKPSTPAAYPSRDYERERERELRERERRPVIGQARSPSFGGDFNREPDRRPHTHASRSPVNTFSAAPQQQQQLSPLLPQKTGTGTGSPSASATSASIHKSPALHNHHTHAGHGQAPGVPNTSRRPPPPQPTSVSLPPPPSVSPVSGRRALDAAGAPVGGPQAPVMSSLRPYDSEPNAARHGRDASLMASVNSASSSNGRDHDRDREQRERDHAYVAGGLSIQQAQQRQRERERTLKDDIDREREFYEQQKRINRSASSGGMPTGQHTTPPMHPSVGREHENERTRREDMDAIRAAAANRQGHAHATQGQRERDAYHPSQPYPPQQHHPQQHHHHPSHTHSHPHSHSAHLHQQQSMPQGPLSQQAHQHQFPLSHSQQPPQAQQKPKGAVLKLAPPGVEVSNNPPSVSTSRTDKPETLTLLPPAHAQAHAQQQQQHQHQHASRSMGSEQGAPSQAPPPTSPTLPLRLAPDQPYINVQPPSLGHGSQSHSPHPNKLGHPSKSYSVVPTAVGPPPNAGPSSLPPAANVQDSMIAAQQARQQHEQRQRQQQEQQYGRHPYAQHRHAHEPPPPSVAASSEIHSVHQLRHHQEAHTHLRRSSIPPSGHPLSHSHGPLPPGPPPPGYPQQHLPNHQYTHGDPHLVPVPMALPLPPPSPTLESYSSEPPLHLGTFIFPRTPFPYFFSTPSERLLSAQQSRRTSEREVSRGRIRREPDAPLPERETHVTILIPTTYLPSTRQRDGRPRIWGGGSTDRALSSSLSQDRHSFYRFTPPHLPRRIYTDDSDLVLCALHAGRISWNGIQRARTAHLDLELRIRVMRDVGQYVGGPSALARGYPSSGAEHGLDLGLEKLLKSSGKNTNAREIREEANWLQSASWESGHDGSGIEVVRAEWVPRASARSCGFRNRSQRLLEYAERRRDIMSLSSVPSARVLGKRPSRNQDTLAIDDDEQDLMSRTVVFGRWNGTGSIGFKYDPATVKTSLFPLPSTISSFERIRRRKRRKLTSSADAPHTEDDIDTHTETEKLRDMMILENDEERFLFTLNSPSASLISIEEADKENIHQDAPEDLAKFTGKGKERKGRKYNIYVIPASGSKVKSGSAPQANGVEGKPVNGNVDRDLTGPNLSELKTTLKDLQLLHSDVGEEALDFQANGLAVLPCYFPKIDATNIPTSLDKLEKGWFMHVQRWRWTGRKEVTVGLS